MVNSKEQDFRTATREELADDARRMRRARLAKENHKNMLKSVLFEIKFTIQEYLVTIESIFTNYKFI